MALSLGNHCKRSRHFLLTKPRKLRSECRGKTVDRGFYLCRALRTGTGHRGKSRLPPSLPGRLRGAVGHPEVAVGGVGCVGWVVKAGKLESWEPGLLGCRWPPDTALITPRRCVTTEAVRDVRRG